MYWDVQLPTRPCRSTSSSTAAMPKIRDRTDPSPQRRASAWITSGDETIYAARRRRAGGDDPLPPPGRRLRRRIQRQLIDFWRLRPGTRPMIRVDDVKPTGTDKFGIYWDIRSRTRQRTRLHHPSRRREGPGAPVPQPRNMASRSGSSPGRSGTRTFADLGGPGTPAIWPSSRRMVAEDTIAAARRRGRAADLRAAVVAGGTLELLDDGTVTGGTAIPLTLERARIRPVSTGCWTSAASRSCGFGGGRLALVPAILRSQSRSGPLDRRSAVSAQTGVQTPACRRPGRVRRRPRRRRGTGETPMYRAAGDRPPGRHSEPLPRLDPATLAIGAEHGGERRDRRLEHHRRSHLERQVLPLRGGRVGAVHPAFESNLVTDPYSVSLATDSLEPRS